MGVPTVSAIIATYNRADVLRRALSELLAQSRPPDEILVVDDASPDETRRMVQTEFPSVRYVRVPRNMGWTHNRNLAVLSTKGDYILSLDDDAWFEDGEGLANAVSVLERHDDVGALALNVRLPNGWLYLSATERERNVAAYIGCACFMRREVAERTLYIPEMLCQEEQDRSLRIYDMGSRVLGVPGIVVFHALSDKNRNWSRFRFLIHRSTLMREIARCPLGLLPWRLLASWGRQTWINLKDGYLAVDLKILWSLPLIVRVGLRNRAPVGLAAYRNWRALAWSEMGRLGPPQGPKQTGPKQAGPKRTEQG